MSANRVRRGSGPARAARRVPPAAFLLVPLALLLGACEQRPHAYVRPGTTEAETRQIQARCVQESQLIAFQESLRLYAVPSFPSRPSFVPGRGWVMGRDPYFVNPTAWRFQREQELADYCMRVQGFQWLPLPATGGLDQPHPGKTPHGVPPLPAPPPSPPPAPPRG